MKTRERDMESVFEGLDSMTAEELIVLADDTVSLKGADKYTLMLFIQELAGRLEDVLNLEIELVEESNMPPWDMGEGDDEEDERMHGTEFNG